MNRGEWKLSYREISRMTLAQIRNLQYQGRPPKPGNRVFKSSAEAQSWREEQQGGL